MMRSILIVDDEEGVRDVLSEILTLSGYNVLTASYAEEAQLIAMEHQCPLIICDITMPGLSGLDFLRKIREANLLSAVVMLTAHSESDKIIEAMQLGAIDYLVKPFDPNEIIERTPTWLEIGKRIVALSNGEADQNSLQNKLRMIELFKLNNHVKSSTKKD